MTQNRADRLGSIVNSTDNHAFSSEVAAQDLNDRRFIIDNKDSFTRQKYHSSPADRTADITTASPSLQELVCTGSDTFV